MQREEYQKMRREQDYNISKIQAGIPYFGSAYVHYTKKWDVHQFLIDQSERTNILIFITTSYGLSIDILKFEI